MPCSLKHDQHNLRSLLRHTFCSNCSQRQASARQTGALQQYEDGHSRAAHLPAGLQSNEGRACKVIVIEWCIGSYYDVQRTPTVSVGATDVPRNEYTL